MSNSTTTSSVRIFGSESGEKYTFESFCRKLNGDSFNSVLKKKCTYSSQIKFGEGLFGETEKKFMEATRPSNKRKKTKCTRSSQLNFGEMADSNLTKLTFRSEDSLFGSNTTTSNVNMFTFCTPPHKRKEVNASNPYSKRRKHDKTMYTNVDDLLFGKSECVYTQLDSLDKKVSEFEFSVGMLEKPIQEVKQIRGELIRTSASVENLLANQIDAVDMSELGVGKEQARKLRKSLVNRVHKLLEQIDELYAQISCSQLRC